MKSLLVYCGASSGTDPLYAQVARDFGYLLAAKKIRLIYGGGSIGLMGIIADAVLEKGGEVTGVIPHFLNTQEVGHTGLTEMHLVHSMHERKALMDQLSDAVVALPGGFGTLDELFEMLTWSQLGLHKKAVGLLNVNGYYDHLLALLARMEKEGFLRSETRQLLKVSTSAEEILELLA